MHILKGDYSELFRTHQKSQRRKQRLSGERKEDCQDEATVSAHEAEADEDCVTSFYAAFHLNNALYLLISTFKPGVLDQWYFTFFPY